ncbi:MAG: type IV toxin-antitoxin system AbiEi family antitoxin domain-containing protein [Candidatus Eremiobacteraeota bacterium]|nr:type IV toxin-antitoxin system AbiEi family antitoxin domain-containing protein [Candidatus Eremiobacteraeota bacterium]
MPQHLSEQILQHSRQLPGGGPIAAKSLLHLGSRAAVDQALSRLTERGQLVRVGRGVYLPPVKGRFGTRLPSVEEAVEAIALQRGEVIVPSGATAANELGLTLQVPVRPVYWTSGRTRQMNLGKQVVEFRHAPRWQLALAQKPAGQAVRALAWLGPEKAEPALQTLKRKLPAAAFRELVEAVPQLPTWLAQSVSKTQYGDG